MSNVKKPEPVAWRYWRESRKRFVYLFKEPKVLQRRHQCLITTGQAEAYANERVREALEQAAGICDRFAGRGMHPAECAGAIRALIPKQ